MKYGFLLKALRALIYIKRFFWWLGTGFYFVLAKFFGRIWRFGAWLNYKFKYFLDKSGLNKTSDWLLRREVLQAVVLVVLFVSAIPQTKLYAGKDTYLPGQKTIAYNLTGTEEDYSLEEVLPETNALNRAVVPYWREGVLAQEPGTGPGQDLLVRDQELAGVVAGGSALYKPTLMPGAVVGSTRTQPVQYIVEPGDSIGTIAYQFGISVATILWENNLTLRSYIQPGQKLVVLPTTGLTHKVKKGDTFKKIASLYGVKPEEIIKFNKFKEDGTDLIIGERIMVPGGIKPQERAVATISRSNTSLQRAAIPPSATYKASASGFIWPSGARMITQYYTWRHHALDVAGPYGTPTYAAKAGTVEKAQCGWNSGYGCVVIINNGSGVKTLYGHHSRLLVSPGDYVEVGQTIGLMGNTGKVRGVTGIHLHFEIRINGVAVNPLGYVR